MNKKPKKKINQQLPQGWDEERVKRVLAHYETQTEAEALAEDEAPFEDPTKATIEVPRELVPKIRRLIARYHTH
ncbi:hypothetical protein HY230_08795 [Candidatus Acetothermia bacterium]|nr:hypothetical protein [Candidatus Acetothermia bacterium]